MGLCSKIQRFQLNETHSKELLAIVNKINATLTYLQLIIVPYNRCTSSIYSCVSVCFLLQITHTENSTKNSVQFLWKPTNNNDTVDMLYVCSQCNAHFLSCSPAVLSAKLQSNPGTQW